MHFCRYSVGKRLLRSRLVCLLGEFTCVVRIDILETKIFAFSDPKWLGAVPRYFDDFFCFHTIAKKRSWTLESSDAGNEERNGGDQKKNPAGNFTDDYKLTVTRLGTVIGKGQRK